MKSALIGFLIITFLLVSLTTAYAFSRIDNALVTEFREQSGRLLIKTQNQTNPESCSLIDYLYLNADGSDVAKRRRQDLFASYLTYKIYGVILPLTIEVTGCSDGGFDGRQIITGVWFK